MSFYIHHIPGRLRVKIPMIQGDEKAVGKVQALLQHFEGIRSVSANTLTGSIVVNYDTSALCSEQILAALKANGYFDESRAVSSDQYIQATVSKVGREVSKAFFGWAVGKAFEGSGLSFLAVLI